MELTREEYEKSFKSLCEIVIDEAADGYIEPRYLRDYYCHDFDVIEQLIKEHFDNPPLKFEELEEGMWVWDNKEKWYRKIVIIFQPCKEYPKGTFKAYADSCETSLDFVEFEENRFYRKEVKE